MTYPKSHQPHPEMADMGIVELAFHDTDNSPLYEDPEQGLLGHIVAANDTAALQLYHASLHTRVFWEAYSPSYGHPFRVAEDHGSCDALRVLLLIYLTDPFYRASPEYPPLGEYLACLKFSPIHVACEAADRDFTLWLLSVKELNGGDAPLLGRLDRDVDCGGRTPLICAVGGLRLGGDVERREAFIYFLLDELGCQVRESDIYYSSVRGREEQRREEGRAAVAGDADSDDTNAEVEEYEEEKELKYSVLDAAIPHASYRMTARLIDAGADVHAWQSWSDSYVWNSSECIIQEGTKGVTALHIASLYGNLEGMRALVDHGGVSVAEMVSRADDHGRIPLHWALLGAADEGPHMVDAEEGNDPEEIPAEDGMTPRSRRMVDTVKWLLEANPDTINARDRQGATVFNYAVKSRAAGIAGILAVLKILFDAGPRASILNHIPNEEFDPVGTTTGMTTVLHDTVDQRYRRLEKLRGERFTEPIEILLAHGADARLCLHRLCAGNWYEPISLIMLDRLLESPTNINDTDPDGFMAMHYLIRHLNQIEAARHLVSRGADVSMVISREIRFFMRL